MSITSTRYVLAVPGLQRSANWYRDILGFEVFEIGDPGWRFARRGACYLMLGECPDASPPNELGSHSYFAYLICEDIDALYQEFIGRGAPVRQPPQDRPWGMREFPLTTIDGHRIMFGQAV